jgi:hypothetical protein
MGAKRHIPLATEARIALLPATVTAPATAPAGVSLPPIIAGRIPRRVMPHRLVLWLALSAPLDLRLSLYRAGESAPFLTEDFACATATQVCIGKNAFVRLNDLQPAGPLPVNELLEYDLRLTAADGGDGARRGEPLFLRSVLRCCRVGLDCGWVDRRVACATRTSPAPAGTAPAGYPVH